MKLINRIYNASFENAFEFPAPLVCVSENTYALELFHGPTLAFKDFGARFLAQCLGHLLGDRKTTILTATSGDTGAAVAHAFWKVPNIEVVILYPQGGISRLQEQLFCTLGGNIKTVAVTGDFDACQALVKRSFDDADLVANGLNSANSINIARLFAQVCYYFEAIAQLPQAAREQVVVSVPCGNFGNLTAGLIAKAIGLPISSFVAATNANRTIPDFLQTGTWNPQATQKTISNAMDVSQPSNWCRTEKTLALKGWPLSQLPAVSIDEPGTQEAMRQLHQLGYVADPHSAIAWQALQDVPHGQATQVFLGTAHPAKFKSVVDEVLNLDLPLPAALANCQDQENFSANLPPNFDELKAFVLDSTFAI